MQQVDGSYGCSMEQSQSGTDTLNHKTGNTQVDPPLTRAFLGIGTNLGDRRAHLNLALTFLSLVPQVDVLALSRVYQTAPMYKLDQPAFWNACIEVQTTLSARALLDCLLAIETLCGRVRQEANGPRTVDLDVLFFGAQQIDVPGLHVPHPKLHERDFVLMPMMDLSPQWIDVRTKKSIEQLLNGLQLETLPVAQDHVWRSSLLGQLPQKALTDFP